MKNFDNIIVYQDEHKIIRTGNIVRHSNQSTKNRGIVFFSSKSLNGNICVRWVGLFDETTGKNYTDSTDESGNNLIKVEE